MRTFATLSLLLLFAGCANTAAPIEKNTTTTTPETTTESNMDANETMDGNDNDADDASSADTSMNTGKTPDKMTTDTSPAAEDTYTMDEVATHADKSSCWAAINGHVYDLTTWINRHPGGPEAILGICGTDATKAFENQHGGQTKPETTLKSFEIGTLEQ